MGGIVADLSKRGAFGSSGEKRMQSVLEGMWNMVYYVLRGSWKIAGKLEEWCDSKVIQSVLNGRTFKYHFGQTNLVG